MSDNDTTQQPEPVPPPPPIQDNQSLGEYFERDRDGSDVEHAIRKDDPEKK